jgi:hypothetical protein
MYKERNGRRMQYEFSPNSDEKSRLSPIFNSLKIIEEKRSLNTAGLVDKLSCND